MDQACSVKMVGYWHCSFLACLWTSAATALTLCFVDATLCADWYFLGLDWLRLNCSIFSKLDSLPKGKSYLKLILKLQNNSYADNFGLTSTYIIKILKIPRSNLPVNFQSHPTISSLYIFYSQNRETLTYFSIFFLWQNLHQGPKYTWPPVTSLNHP